MLFTKCEEGVCPSVTEGGLLLLYGANNQLPQERSAIENVIGTVTVDDCRHQLTQAVTPELQSMLGLQTIGGTAVIQMATKNSGQHTHAVLQSNGQQHILLEKIVANNDNHSGQDGVALHPSNSTLQTVYQYVEAAPQDHTTVYATSDSSGQLQYQEYSSNVYSTTVPTTYYQTAQLRDLDSLNQSAPSSGGGCSVSTGNANHDSACEGQPQQQQVNTTYLVQTSAQLETADTSVPHATRASPITVQWLIDNYETAEGVSLPRSTLYTHYLHHCHEHKVEPMNPASFGKLIRSVFLGLRTRRLGTRGNSKYHYYGIRIKANSHLNQFVEDQSFALRQYPTYHKELMDADDYHGNRHKQAFKEDESSSSPLGPSSSNTGATVAGHHNQLSVQDQQKNNNTSDNSQQQHHAPLQQQQHPSQSSAPTGQVECVAASSSEDGVSAGRSGSVVEGDLVSQGQFRHKLPNLDHIADSVGLSVTHHDCREVVIPAGCSVDDVLTLTRLYGDHCSQVFDAVVGLNFISLENIWQTFWRTSPNEDHDLARQLPSSVLEALCENPAVLRFFDLADHSLYQSLVELLIPDVLRPIASTLTQSIRNFAKSLESWMRNATLGLSPALVRVKVSTVASLAQALRRYTSLNHMAQAARAVLHNSTQINQMLTDLNRVDFANVQDQAAWVCHCDAAIVSQLETDFKKILEQRSSLEQWAEWLDSVVSTNLDRVAQRCQAAPHSNHHSGKQDVSRGGSDTNEDTYSRAARQLLLKWAFYSSLVIRDLTLRSAASFGSFHLIRLLYDEYIFYLVEQKVAAYKGITPLAVMGTGSAKIVENGDTAYPPTSTGHNDDPLNDDDLEDDLEDDLDDELDNDALVSGSLHRQQINNNNNTIINSSNGVSDAGGVGMLSASYNLLMGGSNDAEHASHQSTMTNCDTDSNSASVSMLLDCLHHQQMDPTNANTNLVSSSHNSVAMTTGPTSCYQPTVAIGNMHNSHLQNDINDQGLFCLAANRKTVRVSTGDSCQHIMTHSTPHLSKASTLQSCLQPICTNLAKQPALHQNTSTVYSLAAETPKRLKLE